MKNELLEDKLKHLNEDRLMLEAIEQVFLERIEKEKPIIERSDTDKILGEKYRAYEMAKKLLDEVLKDIQTYLNSKKEDKTFNKEL